MITDNKQLAAFSHDDIKGFLQAAHDSLSVSTFDPPSIQDTLNGLLDTTGQKPGVLFSLIRIAVSWAPFSPALNDTLSALGKDTVLARLQRAIDA
jgi:glutamyl-tRNA synthetase